MQDIESWKKIHANNEFPFPSRVEISRGQLAHAQSFRVEFSRQVFASKWSRDYTYRACSIETIESITSIPNLATPQRVRAFK